MLNYATSGVYPDNHFSSKKEVIFLGFGVVSSSFIFDGSGCSGEIGAFDVVCCIELGA